MVCPVGKTAVLAALIFKQTQVDNAAHTPRRQIHTPALLDISLLEQARLATHPAGPEVRLWTPEALLAAAYCSWQQLRCPPGDKFLGGFSDLLRSFAAAVEALVAKDSPDKLHIIPSLRHQVLLQPVVLQGLVVLNRAPTVRNCHTGFVEPSLEVEVRETADG